MRRGTSTIYLYSGDLRLDAFSWQSGRIAEWSYTVGVAAVGVAAVLGKLVYDYCTAKPDPDKENKNKHKPKH